MTTPDEHDPINEETFAPDETPTEEIPAVEEDPAEESPPQTRRALGAALIGGTVLAIGAALALGSANGHKPEPAPTAPTLPSSPTSTAQHSPTLAPAPTNAPPTPVRPHVRWKGIVMVSGPDTHRDLDSIPPRTSSEDSDLNGRWLETDVRADSSRVQIAVLHGGTPGYSQCRNAAFADGSEETPDLNTGDVLCVYTSQGRIARLTTLYAEQTSGDPIVKFRAVIWDPPAQ